MERPAGDCAMPAAALLRVDALPASPRSDQPAHPALVALVVGRELPGQRLRNGLVVIGPGPAGTGVADGEAEPAGTVGLDLPGFGQGPDTEQPAAAGHRQRLSVGQGAAAEPAPARMGGALLVHWRHAGNLRRCQQGFVVLARDFHPLRVRRLRLGRDRAQGLGAGGGRR